MIKGPQEGEHRRWGEVARGKRAKVKASLSKSKENRMARVKESFGWSGERALTSFTS